MSKAPIRRPEDLGAMGESYFRLLAKDAGLVANASDDDKAGWDFEVELPNPLQVDYGRQSRPTYRVQVKATMGADCAVSVTFSSLVSLLQYGGPSYIVLFQYGEDLVPKAAYCLHVGEELSVEILTNLRRRQVADPKIRLNRAKMSIRFDASMQLTQLTGEGLKLSLERGLGGSSLSYLDSKSKWLRKIEQESEALRFDVRFENEDSLKSMADCLLGYEKPFKVSSVAYVAPFGIADKTIVHTDEFLPTVVLPIEENLPRMTLRLRTSPYGTAYEFQAVIYAVPPEFPREHAAIRIRTSMFDMIFRHAQQSLEFCAVDIADDDIRAQVNEVRNYIKYMGEARSSSTTYVELTPSDGSRSLSVSLDTHSVGVSEDFDDILESMEILYSKLSQLNLTTVLMRPADVLCKGGVLNMLRVVGKSYEPPFIQDFGSGQDVKSDTQVVLFNSAIRLEGRTVVCYAAFFGEVTANGGAWRGTFTRSEYLGEIVVSADDDLEAAKSDYVARQEEVLRKRGFVMD